MRQYLRLNEPFATPPVHHVCAENPLPYISPIRDQAQCGTCVAHAIVAAAEAAMARAYNQVGD